jgi:hypothetical protein
MKEAEARREELKALEELNRIKQEQSLDELFSGLGTELTSIDPEDALKIAKPLYERITQDYETRYRSLATELESQKQVLAKERAEANKLLEGRQQQYVNAKLKEAVPDLETLIRTEAYAKFLGRPVTPGGRTTMQDYLNRELSLGNVDLVVNKFREFASARPNVADITQVGAVTTATRAVPEPARVDNISDLRSRVNARRSGQIRNNADYRAIKQGQKG